MNNLPEDLILQRILNSDYKDVKSLCATNKYYKNICDTNENYIYSQLLKRDFIDPPTNPKLKYILYNKLTQNGVKFFDKSQHYYILIHNLPNIEKYIDLGFDINSKSKNNATPLMYALLNSPSEMVNKMLDLKPDINIKTDYGSTPLMYALEYATPEIINRILDLKPDINNETALTYALELKSSPEIINKILNLNPNIRQ